MPPGWLVNLAEGAAYFTAERLETEAWDNLPGAVEQTKVLTQAYNRILYDDRFNIPAVPTPADLVILKKAQCEMAYYLCIHIADEDRRKGIQVQGTIQAGIVKETYDREMLEKLPVPPFVLVLLAPFAIAAHLLITDIDRDEDKAVSDPSVIDIPE